MCARANAPSPGPMGGALVDGERLWTRLTEMSTIGAQEGGASLGALSQMRSGLPKTW
jgi:hypothetical protein